MPGPYWGREFLNPVASERHPAFLLTRSHAAARPGRSTGSGSDLAGAPCCHSSPRLESWTWTAARGGFASHGHHHFVRRICTVRWSEWPNGYTVHPPPIAFKRPIKTGLAVRCRALNSVQIGRNVCIWPCDRVSGFRTRIAAISHEF